MIARGLTISDRRLLYKIHDVPFATESRFEIPSNPYEHLRRLTSTGTERYEVGAELNYYFYGEVTAIFKEA